MADIEGDEARLNGLDRLLEREDDDDNTLATEGNPSLVLNNVQSTMEGHFTALKGSINEGFSSLGELLTGLMQQQRGKRSRQKSSSSSTSVSEDSDHEGRGKRARLTKDDNEDAVAALLAESEPKGEKSDHDKEFGEILDKAVQDLDSEQLGPNVSDQLAQVINKTLRSKLSEEKLKDKKNTYLRPQNCETLEAPRVNPEIWTQLQPTTRSRDIRLQKVQSLLLKGLMPLVELLETCRQSKDTTAVPDKGTMIKLVLDSITLLSQANGELNCRRRAMIKPDLNEKFQQICADHVPVTTLLFGDEVAKTLQDIASTNRVSQQVAGPSRRSSYMPQHNSN